MSAIRIGFSSDFVLKNQRVGVGTTNPRATLDVVGTLKGDFNISGVTTLTSYAGFVPQKQSGDGVTITGEVNTISEDIIVNVGETFIVSSGSTISIGTLESISIGAHLSVPNGGITLRPQDPIEGTVRFNDDLNTLEFYNGVEWRQFTVTGASGRGVFGSGSTPTSLSTTNIDFINISTTGNAVNFGILTEAKRVAKGFSSSIRGIIAGGYRDAPANTYTNVIEYITIASAGNSIDFGDLQSTKGSGAAFSSSTRGIYAGAGGPTTNVIDYVQISTIGNSLDFGDLIIARENINGCSSPTRGICGGGSPSPSVPPMLSSIEFLTISSKGNANTFGNLTESRRNSGSCSNSTRGIFAGGNTPTNVNTIDYITIASVGNAQDFGDLQTTGTTDSGSCASQIRAVIAGGYVASASINNIDYITIATTGNAQDFGDLTEARNGSASLSDSHGGLGGY
jgi:hypothetical protein